MWRIPRPLTRKQIDDRLANLPTVFADIAVFRSIDLLRSARALGHFEFRLLERGRQA